MPNFIKLVIIFFPIFIMMISSCIEIHQAPIVVPTPPPLIPSKPPNFSVSFITTNPRVANVGEPVKVSVQINNTGGSGDYKAIMLLDNEVIDSKIVPVGELKTGEVTFSPVFTKIGKYSLRIGEAKTVLVVSDCTQKKPYSIQYDAGAAYANLLYGTGSLGQMTFFTPPALPFLIQKILLYSHASVDSDSELDQHNATITIWDSKKTKLWSQDYPWRMFQGFSTWKEFEIANVSVSDEFSVEFTSHSEPVRPRNPFGMGMEVRYTCIPLGATRPVITSPSEILRFRSSWSIDGVPQKSGPYDILDWLIRVEGQGCLLENKTE